MTNKLLIGSLLTLASITPLLTSANDYVYSQAYDGYIENNSWANEYSEYQAIKYEYRELFDYSEMLFGSTSDIDSQYNYYVNYISGINGFISDHSTWALSSSDYENWSSEQSCGDGEVIIPQAYANLAVNSYVNTCRLSDTSFSESLFESELQSNYNSSYPFYQKYTLAYNHPEYLISYNTIYNEIFGSSGGGNGGSSSDGDLRGEESYNGFVGSMGNVSGNLSSSIISFMRVILPFAVGIIALIGLFRYIRNKSKKAVKIGGSGNSAVSGYTRNRANLGQYKLRRKRLINKRRFN